MLADERDGAHQGDAGRSRGGLLGSGTAITDELGKGWIEPPQITERLTQTYLRQRGKEVPY